MHPWIADLEHGLEALDLFETAVVAQDTRHYQIDHAIDLAANPRARSSVLRVATKVRA